MNGPIVSVELLEQHLGDWVIADCRHNLQDVDAGKRAFEAGHIPGAIFFHLERADSRVQGTGFKQPLHEMFIPLRIHVIDMGLYLHHTGFLERYFHTRHNPEDVGHIFVIPGSGPVSDSFNAHIRHFAEPV